MDVSVQGDGRFRLLVSRDELGELLLALVVHRSDLIVVSAEARWHQDPSHPALSERAAKVSAMWREIAGVLS